MSWLRKIASSLGLGLMLISISVASVLIAIGSSSTSDVPVLTVDERIIDLGVIGQGKEASRTFTIYNSSDHAAFFSGIYTSCSCLTPELDTKKLLPGESTILKVQFHSGKSRGRVFNEYNVFYVVGDTQEIRRIPLRLTADVVPDILLSADLLTFQSDQSEHRDVVLSPGLIKEVNVLEMRCSHPAFSAVLEATNSAQESIEESVVKVEFDSTKWRGYARNPRLLVKTNSKNEPELSIDLIVRSP